MATATVHTTKRSLSGPVVLALGLLTALGPLSIDLYLPAFPAMRHELHATDGAVQFTLAGMTFGLALGQLVIGSWSDRIGRRTPLLLSVTLHVAATAGCALAPSIGVLGAFRVAQGIGAAGGSVLVLAMVCDTTEGRALVVLLSHVTLVTTTVPLLAPVAGAELLALVGWRGIFGVLAAASAVMLVVAVFVAPETHRPSPAAHRLGERVRAVLGDVGFRWAALVGSMTYAGVYAYVAASPMLLQDVYGLTPRTYSVVFLLNSLGLVAGVQLSSVLAKRVGAARALIGWAAVTVLAAAAAAPLQWAGTGIAGLLPCLWCFVTGCGGCFPCAAALALDGQGRQSGTATSLYGFATFTTAGLVSPVAGLIGITSAWPVVLVLLTCSLVALLATVPLLRLTLPRARHPLHAADGFSEASP